MPSLRTDRATTDSGADTTPSFTFERPAWMADGLCLEPSMFDAVGMHMVDAEFSRTAKPIALQVCGRCLCRADCLEYALADPTLVGIWGGTDTAARRAIRSNRNRKDRAHATA